MFRYSEVIYNKAEALMRKNGGKATQEVVDMINSVRQRSFKAEDWEKAKYTTATLTMDEFLAEKGRVCFRRNPPYRLGSFQQVRNHFLVGQDCIQRTKA